MSTVTEQFTISVSVTQPQSGLTATYVVPNGPKAGTYIYSEAGGTGQTVRALDNYIDPDGAFTMTCTVVTRTDTPLVAIIRKSNGAAGSHSQIIWECCNAFATDDQNMMPAHGSNNTVTISQSGTTIATVSVQGQWGLGRWRWQSGLWPFGKDVTTLRAQRRLPTFDLVFGQGYGNPPNVTTYNALPMHLPTPGAPINMMGGGDIPILSDADGYWACYGTSAALANMLNAADSLCTYPWFMRDPATWGVPNAWQTYPTKTNWAPSPGDSQVTLDFVGTPNSCIGGCNIVDELNQTWEFMWTGYAITDSTGHLKGWPMHAGSVFPGASEPFGPFTISPSTPLPTGVTVTSITRSAISNGSMAIPGALFVQGSGLNIDDAHAGSLWMMAWIATGDPYYLEAIHSKHMFTFATHGIPTGGVKRATLNYPQIRATAYQLSALMISAATTPYVTPRWLLPRSLWQSLWADEMRLSKSQLVGGSTPGSTVFHSYGATAGGAQSPWGSLEPWQESLVLPVTSFAAMMMPTCRFLPQWHSSYQISMLGGNSSGWPPMYPVFYDGVWEANNGTWLTSWVNAWNYNVTTNPTDFPPLATALAATSLHSSTNYCCDVRFALSMAKQAGITGLDPYLGTLTSVLKAIGQTDGWNRLTAAVAPAIGTTITGATVNGTLHAPDTLANLVAATPTSGTLVLPAGIWSGVAAVGTACTIQGAGINQTIIDATGLTLAGGGKGVFEPTVAGVTIRDMTIMGAAVAVDNDGAGIREAGNGIGWTAINVEMTGNQDGLLSFASNITLTNCLMHENGAGDGLSHEMYFNGSPSTSITLTGVTSACGIYSTHALKSRAGTTTVSGGSYAGNPDGASTSVAGSVIDIPNGGVVSISNTMIIVASTGVMPVNLFLGYAMENGLNMATGNTVTLTNVHLRDLSGTGGVIQAQPTNAPTAHLALVGVTYDGPRAPTLTGWASVTGTMTAV